MATINERFKQLRLSYGDGQFEFGQRIGTSQKNVSNAEKIGYKGVNNYIQNILDKIPHVNYKWLKTGKGEMFLKDGELNDFSDTQNDEVNALKILKKENDFLKEELRTKNKLIERLINLSDRTTQTSGSVG